MRSFLKTNLKGAFNIKVSDLDLEIFPSKFYLNVFDLIKICSEFENFRII